MSRVRTAFVVSFIVLAGSVLGGCALPVSATGYVGNYDEVLYGQTTASPSEANYTVALEPSGVTCSIHAYAKDLFGNWGHDVTCSDGRTVNFDTHAIALGVGEGRGVMSDGRPLYFLSGLQGNAERKLEEFRATQRRILAQRAPAPTPAPAPSAASVRAAAPAVASLNLSYSRVPERPDDVAVIIGNRHYGTLGKDIPDVEPASADAAEFKRFVVQAQGVREGNVIDLRDATAAHLASVFGTEKSPRGQLHDWVRAGRSRVWVYYAGHGAPAGTDGGASLVPVDADASRIEINGYPLATLYRNLGQLQAESVTVVLEACFSGVSQAGSILPKASGIYLRPTMPEIPPNVTVVAAGAADQIASWEQDGSHGLFTKFFLKAMSGEADTAPYGNGDGRVELDEVRKYLDDTLTYYARRYYGRDQKAQFVVRGRIGV